LCMMIKTHTCMSESTESTAGAYYAAHARNMLMHIYEKCGVELPRISLSWA